MLDYGRFFTKTPISTTIFIKCDYFSGRLQRIGGKIFEDTNGSIIRIKQLEAREGSRCARREGSGTHMVGQLTVYNCLPVVLIDCKYYVISIEVDNVSFTHNV